MKIYTKSGDGGTSSLFGGQRVPKDSKRLAAYGTVDELNCQLGVVIANNSPADVFKKLVRVQGELFVLGGDLASPLSVKVKIPRISKSYISRLEKEIDIWQKQLSPLKNFILPGGGKIGANLHLARTVARRAEREIVKLSNEERINANIFPYINRLSDWLFVLARYVNHLEKIPETYWSGRE